MLRPSTRTLRPPNLQADAVLTESQLLVMHDHRYGQSWSLHLSAPWTKKQNRTAAAPADTDRRVFLRVGSRVFRRFDFGLLLGCA